MVPAERRASNATDAGVDVSKPTSFMDFISGKHAEPAELSTASEIQRADPRPTPEGVKRDANGYIYPAPGYSIGRRAPRGND